MSGQTVHPTSAKFCEVLDSLKSLHLRKAADYGSDKDPLENIRACSAVGVAPFTGAVVRMMDKVQRIKAFMVNGKLENESLEDALKDLASYAVICLVLRQEAVA